MTGIESYQPKGGMCATCKHANKNCSYLDFKNMPRLSSSDGVTIVRCWEFIKIKGMV